MHGPHVPKGLGVDKPQTKQGHGTRSTGKSKQGNKSETRQTNVSGQQGLKAPVPQRNAGLKAQTRQPVKEPAPVSLGESTQGPREKPGKTLLWPGGQAGHSHGAGSRSRPGRPKPGTRGRARASSSRGTAAGEGNVWARRRQILTSKGYLKLAESESHPGWYRAIPAGSVQSKDE